MVRLFKFYFKVREDPTYKLLREKLYYEEQILKNEENVYVYSNDTKFPLISIVSGGPIGAYYTKCKGKEIYVFEDKHTEISKQPTLPSTTKNAVSVINAIRLIVMSNPSLTIDFFIEDFNDPGKAKRDIIATLNHLVNLYGEESIPTDALLTLKKYNNSSRAFIDITRMFFDHHLYYNLRRHNFDYGIGKTEAERQGFPAAVKEEPDKNAILFRHLLTVRHYDKAINSIPRLKKQIDNVTDETMRITLYELMYQSAVDKDTDEFAFERRIIDFYLVARIFRKFNDYESKYIIIYAGRAHTEWYQNLFEKLDDFTLKSGEPIDKKNFIRDNNQVNVSLFNLPFFEANIDERYKKKVSMAIQSGKMKDVYEVYKQEKKNDTPF